MRRYCIPMLRCVVSFGLTIAIASPVMAQAIPRSDSVPHVSRGTFRSDSTVAPRHSSMTGLGTDSMRKPRGDSAAATAPLRDIFVRELIRSTSSFEAGPNGLKVSNIPVWVFLLLVVGVVLSGSLASKSSTGSNREGLSILLAGLLILSLLVAGGYWFGRWRVQRDLARTERALVLLQQNTNTMQVQLFATRDTVASLRGALARTQQSLANAPARLVTPNMVWAIIVGAFFLLLPLTWSVAPDFLRRREWIRHNREYPRPEMMPRRGMMEP